MPNELLEAALRYASWGWHVFPLRPRGKLPLISKKAGGRGFYDATTDAATIERWWHDCPNANIGVATGVSDLVVLDPDGEEGLALMRRASGGDLPRTLTSRTGRDQGYHLIYRARLAAGEPAIPSFQKRGIKLDVRGSTGYIVAPPSIHENGRVYTFLDTTWPTVDAPAWIGPWIARQSGGQASQEGASTVAPSAGMPVQRPAYVAPSVRPADTARAGRESSLSGRGLLALQEPETRYTRNNVQRVRAALKFVPPDLDGKKWVTVGNVLHDLQWIENGVDQGFELWDEFSARSEGKGPGNGEYRGRGDLEKRWAGFSKEFSGIKASLGTVFGLAYDHGWDGIVPEEMPKINGFHALPPQFAEASTGTNGAGAAFSGASESGFIVFPDRNKNKVLATCRNTRVAIQALGLVCEHDLFHDKLRIAGHALGDWGGDVTDNVVHMLRVIIESRFHFDPGTIHAHDAAVQECLQHGFDPVQDYLDDLKWDGMGRLDHWMPRYLGAEANLFNCAVSRLSLVAAVRRARQPGCKFDQVIVLEGPEGRGKSSAIEILAGTENFSDQTILTLDDRAQQEALQGTWIYEIADFAGHGRAEIERTKALLSRTHDRARPAYGRSRVDRPRRCVFFATTNDSTYLKSQTGNRRFWPVRCERIDLDALARDRDQLWAEAAMREVGARLVLPEKLWGEATQLQDSRRDLDPWDEHLRGTLGKLTDDKTEYRISTSEVLAGRLQLPIERQNEVTAKRVVFTMRRLGWDGPKVMRIGSELCRGYSKPTKIDE